MFPKNIFTVVLVGYFLRKVLYIFKLGNGKYGSDSYGSGKSYTGQYVVFAFKC